MTGTRLGASPVSKTFGYDQMDRMAKYGLEAGIHIDAFVDAERDDGRAVTWWMRIRRECDAGDAADLRLRALQHLKAQFGVNDSHLIDGCYAAHLRLRALRHHPDLAVGRFLGRTRRNASQGAGTSTYAYADMRPPGISVRPGC